jgi:hypothetical protein
MSNYRFLKEGEVIKEDDQWLGWEGISTPGKTYSVGERVNARAAIDKCYRRRLHTKKPSAPVVVQTSFPTQAQIAEVVKPAEVVTPPVQYRFLQEGEVASAKTDEVNCMDWEKVSGLDGHVIETYDKDNFRRPVRMQDAKHRFLDLGEKIVRGDDWAYKQNDTWWAKSLCQGDTIRDHVTLNNGKEPLIYRRLLTPEVKVEDKIEVKPVVIPGSQDDKTDFEAKPTTFTHELKLLVAKYKLETGSDTPDYVLAKYLVNCLKAFDGATTARDDWYATHEEPPTPVV